MYAYNRLFACMYITSLIFSTSYVYVYVHVCFLTDLALKFIPIKLVIKIFLTCMHTCIYACVP